MTVLMSAIPQGKPEMVEDGKRKLYQFQQPIPIPSYLIAIAAGNLEARKIGPRSHVWSEPEVVDAAASKLDDTEDLLKIAEELSGPYIWGIYDILVLPPSFAYSGMENPCLTFISPHILQGEKAHVKLMAHEIAHSWTGNLVTNKNFEHFWINEGFTMFVGRRIQGLVSGGRAMESLEALGDWKQLENYVNEVVTDDHPLTSLVVNLTGLNPHDSFNPIPYHKGSVFLWYLEGIVGGPAIMETFLKSYYKSFAYKSIDSTEFKGYFENYFKNETKINSIDWDTWLNGRGMPPYRPNYDESLSQACKDLAQKWINLDTDVSADLTTSNREWTILSPEQKREFMSVLLAEKEPLSVEKLQLMDELYQLNGMKHWEIRSRWIRLGLKGHWDHAIPRAVEMVSEGGDIMLTIGPIYRDMYDWEKAREAALEAFEKNRSSMMKVAVHSVMKDLKISESES